MKASMKFECPVCKRHIKVEADSLTELLGECPHCPECGLEFFNPEFYDAIEASWGDEEE